MSRKLIAPASVLICVAGLCLLGCGKPAAGPKESTSSKEANAPAKPQADAPKAASGLDQLDPADRQLAEKQKLCPVSDEPLGKMGKPYKVIVKGRTVFLCCDGCEAAIKKDPDKYLAKLDKQGK